ncbi:MAG: hypothetical protein IJ363_00740 [Clostridia bacterium]|nr:hypothetical protein [Clostridia bacterium]
MKRSFLQALTLLVTLTLLATAAAFPAMAEETAPAPKTLLALGDSLTTGYGLKNYTYGGDPYLCDSYINRIAAAYGLEGGKTYINRAVNGDRTGDLARLLPSLENEVKNAEMIILTIGGNDLLGLLPEIAYMLSGQEVSDFTQAAAVFAAATAEQYDALKNDPAFVARMKTVLEDVGTNLQTIATFFKEKAPDARVIFLKQYNPMHNVQGFEAFGEFGGGFLTSINQAVEQVATAFGYETVDVPAVIDHRAEELTNIRLYDIHPNAEGHHEIAKAVAQHLGLSPEQSEDTEAPTDPETEAPTDPETEAPTDPETEEPTEAPTEAPTDPITEAPTEAPADKPADTDAPADKKGCGASLGLLSVLMMSVCAAFVLKRSR